MMSNGVVVATIAIAACCSICFGQTVTCPQFPQLTNGFIDSGDGMNGSRAGNVNDMVYFTCNTNYTLNGSVSALCQSNGTWTTVLPMCRIVLSSDISCSDIFSSVASTGKVSRAGPYYSGNMVNFKCNSGLYFPDGSNSWNYYCDTSRQWSDSSPICTAPPSGDAASGAAVNTQYVVNIAAGYAYCGRITSSFPDGQISYSGGITYMGNSYYQRATFSCSKGYTLSGSTNTTCKFSSNYRSTVWSIKTMPTCKAFAWTWQTALIVVAILAAIVAAAVFCCLKFKNRFRPMQTTTVVMMQQPQCIPMQPQPYGQVMYPMAQTQQFGQVPIQAYNPTPNPVMFYK